MEGLLLDIELSSFSRALSSNPYSFHERYKSQAVVVLKQAVALCACALPVSSTEFDDGDWWKKGLCLGILGVLLRVHSLLEDCGSSSTPTFHYSSRDFSSLWSELSWYEKIVDSSPLQLSLQESSVDSMCLNDDVYKVFQEMDHNPCPAPATMESCEIEHGMLDFHKDGVIRDRDGIGRVQKVGLKGQKGSFASKMIHPNLLAEIRIHLKLNHPHIVRVKGWCQSGMPVPVLVTELMDTDLRKWINTHHPSNLADSLTWQRSPLNWQYMLVAIDILHQVAQAMRHIQRCNVAHRDLKAENILVREHKHEGHRVPCFVTAKIADFGVSKQKPDGRFTTERQGTRTYRAPEVMTAEENGKYSFEADIWSFGVVAWELLTGQTPEKDGVPQSWPESMLWLPSLVVHPYLLGCIQRCWAEQPAGRPSFESICITLQYLKRSMFRNKGVYHASAVALAGKTPLELAKQHLEFQGDLRRWWVTVLSRDLQPSIRPASSSQDFRAHDAIEIQKALNLRLLRGYFDDSLVLIRMMVWASEYDEYDENDDPFRARILGIPHISPGSRFKALEFKLPFWSTKHALAMELCTTRAMESAISESCAFCDYGNDTAKSIRFFFGILERVSRMLSVEYKV